jgi:hypothetical protein
LAIAAKMLFVERLRGLVATSAGFEPATVGLEVRCSIQLSYEANSGSLGFQAPATTNRHAVLNIAML